MGQYAVGYDLASGGWYFFTTSTTAIRGVDGRYFKRATPSSEPTVMPSTPPGADCALDDAFPLMPLIDAMRRPQVVDSLTRLGDGTVTVRLSYPNGGRCADTTIAASGPTIMHEFDIAADGSVRTVRIDGPPVHREVHPDRWPGSKPGFQVCATVFEGDFVLESATWYDKAPPDFLDPGRLSRLAQSRRSSDQQALLSPGSRPPSGTSGRDNDVRPVASTNGPPNPLSRYGLPLIGAGVLLAAIGLYGWIRRRFSP